MGYTVFKGKDVLILNGDYQAVCALIDVPGFKLNGKGYKCIGDYRIEKNYDLEERRIATRWEHAVAPFRKLMKQYGRV